MSTERREKRQRPERGALGAWESVGLYFTCDGKALEGDRCSLMERFCNSQSFEGFSSLVVRFPVCGTVLESEWRGCRVPIRGGGHHSGRETLGA